MAPFKRERHEMPDAVRQALLDEGLLGVYHARPPHQQNDDIGWIVRIEWEGTRRKPVREMLDELRSGDRYITMAYHARLSG